jgi:hypothetical protein
MLLSFKSPENIPQLNTIARANTVYLSDLAALFQLLIKTRRSLLPEGALNFG